MNSPMLRATGAVLLTLALAPAAQAQVSANRVAAETAWSVFVDENPKECWAVSAPTETLNTKDGSPVSVRRGDILLFVTYRPGNPVELSFTGGYPFAEGSTVSVDIGGTKFELSTFTDSPEWAWSGSPDEDAKIVAALKAGASAVLTARSSRGTQTQDTFSLIGVSSALDQAEKRCAG
ncbi:invasion associated locus B family protein [Defluviimonas aestuarii]|uniref:invasion associated locus B family protein n=1 Tax=Albidovulum aestuarii TaxID=1130726 RepID=UPI00249BDB9B|nr:invasion associated locus B family protein [Defluviimonas aestuarii]MDI3338656.1 invasion associated locus B family protein [Defluviimonas aestuarii]